MLTAPLAEMPGNFGQPGLGILVVRVEFEDRGVGITSLGELAQLVEIGKRPVLRSQHLLGEQQSLPGLVRGPGPHLGRHQSRHIREGQITGVVTNGLFAVKPADRLLIGGNEGTRTLLP